MKYRIDIDYYKYGEGYSHTETIENTDDIPLPNLSAWEWEWDDKYYYAVRCVDNETETTLWKRWHEVHEAIECCPHCGTENTYPDWDADRDGYIAVCECGRKIFLCDECFHADDNPNERCDWHETETGGECFRGKIEEGIND